MNKICVYGAGAVGGFIAAMLARTGCPISAVDRGDTLAALQQHGLRVQLADETFSVPVTASGDPADLGIQDLVIVALKSQVMPVVAPGIAQLIGPETIVLTAMNGVPWWFFSGFGGRYAGLQLESVDPGGRIARAIPTSTVIGGVVHGSFALNEPGFVRHVFGRKLIIGEPNGSASQRLQELAKLLVKAGLEIEVSNAIQRDIWFKLWGNMTMNPVSAITGATCDRILDDPLVRDFCNRVMQEAAEIGRHIGCPVDQTPEERNAVTRTLGAFKTSMLQDVEGGRAVELDALVSSVREIGQQVGVATPDMDTLLGLARLHARVRGLYPDT